MNALKVLELLGESDIPVSKGMGKSLVRALAPDPFSHGSDGQAEYHLPAPKLELSSIHGADMIIETVKKNAGDIHILALGPLTNVALALMIAPEIKPMISSITAIAGSYGLNKYATANATGDNPQSEWNVYVDPEAAEIVGILVTHEHSDHIRGLGAVARKYNLPIYANEKTWEAMRPLHGIWYGVR